MSSSHDKALKFVTGKFGEGIRGVKKLHKLGLEPSRKLSKKEHTELLKFRKGR